MYNQQTRKHLSIMFATGKFNLNNGQCRSSYQLGSLGWLPTGFEDPTDAGNIQHGRGVGQRQAEGDHHLRHEAGDPGGVGQNQKHQQESHQETDSVDEAELPASCLDESH